VVLLVLIGLVARLDAAVGDDSIALARRYANILTGDDPHDGDDDAEDTDDDDTDDDDTEADETNQADAPNHARGSTPGRSGDAELAARTDDTADDRPRDPAIASSAGADDEIGGGAADDDHEAGSGGGATAGEPGQLALLDAEQAPRDAATVFDASAAASAAGAAERHEWWMRLPRPSLWGRLDLGVSWRTHWSHPRYAPARRSDEVWLLATWRR